MRNVKLVIAYDGTSYLGWQKNNAGNSIEESLEKALFTFNQKKMPLQAASRTDNGVHAKGQVVNFQTEHFPFSLEEIQRRLNRLLPDDIVVLSVEDMEEEFHPTLACVSKEYHYHLCYGAVQLPHHRMFSWHYPRPLDIDKMQKGAKLLIGEHNFAAFTNYKKTNNTKNFVRKLSEFKVEKLPEKRLHLIVAGNSFLYKMVRNLVGTIAYVGSGKIKLEAILELLEKRDRTEAGMTAPAHGLTLEKVIY